MSGYPDASPSSGSGKKGKDIAEKGSGKKLNFNPKSVGVEPNEGAPTLNGGKNRPGID